MGMLAGLLLRVWSARTLGRFYTRTLRTDQDQSVVQSGPYAFVRHPGYAADILLWFGFGLAVGNALVLGAITSVMAGVYGLRIRAEEAMLVQALGTAYVHYQARTARLIPGLL